MTPYYQDDAVTIYHGDCREILPQLEQNSIDTVITDPPYGIGFMGKAWDIFDPAYQEKMSEIESKRRPRQDGRKATSFQGAAYAGLYDQSLEGHRNFQTWSIEWAKAALRVAKPGSTMLVCGGTRTFHRMISGIEDAGWKIKDCLMWVYGSGFPKSHDISKAIDKEKGVNRPGVEIESSELAKLWSGYGTALKPAWEPIILAMKPLDGTYGQNAEKWGVAGLNIDESRIETDGRPARVVDPKPEASGAVYSGRREFGHGFDGGSKAVGETQLGRWPANVIHDGSEEVLEHFPHAKGAQRAVGPQYGARDSINAYGDYGPRPTMNPRGDQGSAARFFYTAKASPAERNGSDHPTIKPLKLMEYLCVLTKTPTGGIVLDPFMGSGTTLRASKDLGRKAIGIEIEEKYCEIAARRMSQEVLKL